MTVNSDWLVCYVRVCLVGSEDVLVVMADPKRKRVKLRTGLRMPLRRRRKYVSACFDHGCIVVVCVSMCVHVNRVECLDELPCG